MTLVALQSERRPQRPFSRAWASPRTLPIAVAIIGPGGVGGALLEQWRQIQKGLAECSRKPLELRAICNSKRMVLSASGLALDEWEATLADASDAPDFDRLTYFLHQHVGDVVIVDVTASAEVAAMHPEWLQCGFKVITANKHGVASDTYAAIKRAEKSGGGSYHCETTVGAGLPILGVVADLVRTGDEIHKIEGVLSGTLSHLLARVAGGELFSRALRILHEAGFTEPDPRHDLSGIDVARKSVILARMAGIKLSLEDVELESCVPLEGLAELPVNEFLSSSECLDQFVANSVAEAHKCRGVVRYTSTITRAGKARVAPLTLPKDHPLAQIPAGDNLVRITSRRYAQSPLVIQGPGAGRDVTAAGLLADLIRLAD
ncbi:MAG: hypothetical protein RL011_2226 [Pseudomonadota bacterium]